MQIILDLTEKEIGYLTAAVCQLFHDMKKSSNDKNLGALINDEKVLAARSLWRKVEEQTKIAEWD